MQAVESATVIQAHGRRLSKLIRADGTSEAYDRARLVDLHQVALASLDALADLLRDLAERRDCAVVRGAILDPDRTRGVRRLLHADTETGDAATLRETPRHWIALDVDSLPLPPGTDPRDLAGCAGAVLAHLPEAFRQARALVQATASHAIKPGARVRLWYWCSRPLSGAECKRWMAEAQVDRSVFGAAQLIYTARPIFDGMADPIPCRMVILPGANAVQAPSPAALAPPLQPALPAPSNAFKGDEVTRFAALLRVVQRAPEGERHRHLFWAACRAGELVARGTLAPDAAAGALVAAAMAGGGRSLTTAEATARDGLLRGIRECGR